jgi:hypothetical protein
MGCRPSGLIHIQQVRSVFQQVLGLVLGGAGSGDRARRAVVVEPCGRIGTT